MNSSVYHRTESFYKDLLQCREMLAPLFGTAHLPLILTSSGTGALEAAITNLTDTGDEVIVVDGGKFGNRWKKLATAYQLTVHPLDIEWGSSIDPVQIKQLLEKNQNVKAVFFQANETSTGVQYDVASVAKAIRETSDALIVVDAVSSIGAHNMEMDNWGLDCVVSGSQKGFGIPPGLAFITLSERAWDRVSDRPKFYFDLELEKKNQATGSSSWTPGISLVAALKVTLQQMHDANLKAVFDHHARAAEAVRAGVRAMGLELLASKHYSNAVTAIKIPDGTDGLQLISHLRENTARYSRGDKTSSKEK